MKLDLKIIMKNLDGTPITKTDKANEPFTLLDVVCTALLNEPPNAPPLSGQEKSRRYALAVKAFGSNGLPLEVTIDEAKLIQDQVAATYQALVCGQVWKIMEAHGDDDR